jgi:hypothetical protein
MIRDPESRSGIRKKSIPDPRSESKGQKGTRSRIRIRNTDHLYCAPSRTSPQIHILYEKAKELIASNIQSTYTWHWKMKEKNPVFAVLLLVD